MAIEIRKDSQIVEVATAAARHERLDSKVREDADKLIKDLASNPNPNNKYQISQLVRFAVNDIVRRDTNWLEVIADTKRVGFGEKASFDVCSGEGRYHSPDEERSQVCGAGNHFCFRPSVHQHR